MTAFNRGILADAAECGIPLERLHFFSDDASSQFKNRFTLSILLRPTLLHRNVQEITITESKEDFIENLSTQVFKLTRYTCICYTAKCQSGYMKKLKTSMTPMEEIIVQGDFAKNYSYVVQDEIQIGSMLHINDRG